MAVLLKRSGFTIFRLIYVNLDLYFDFPLAGLSKNAFFI